MTTKSELIAMKEKVDKEIKELEIKILSTELEQDFTRQVTDVTFWEGFYIISW